MRLFTDTATNNGSIPAGAIFISVTQIAGAQPATLDNVELVQNQPVELPNISPNIPNEYPEVPYTVGGMGGKLQIIAIYKS